MAVAASCLRLVEHVRDLGSMPTVLQQAACIFSGHEIAFGDSEKSEDTVPTLRALLAWEVRLDLMSMLFDQEELASDSFAWDRHVCADQSPQQGFQFLCARMRAVRWVPNGASGANFEFVLTSLAPSVSGHGKSSGGDIAYRLVHSFVLSTVPCLDRFRAEVRSWLAGQSKEKFLLTYT